MTTFSEYNQQAQNFLSTTGTKITTKYSHYGTMPYWNDNQNRHIFKVTITRNKKRFTVKFGQSLYEGSNEPSYYSILACLVKYDVGTFENFCNEFGYNIDSRQAKKLYKALKKEWENVERLFSDVLEQLQEIY
jgi:hypothetical protein